jgi:hypothetical protein
VLSVAPSTFPPLLQPKRKDGGDYKRGTWLAMIMGVFRHVNSAFSARRLQNHSSESHQLQLNAQECELIRHNLDSVCQQLTKEGKGTVDKEPAYTGEELEAIVAYLQALPNTSFKHAARGYIILGLELGLRASEWDTILRR